MRLKGVLQVPVSVHQSDFLAPAMKALLALTIVCIVTLTNSQNTQCPPNFCVGYTCCRIDAYWVSCCPAPNAKCCPGGTSCCPWGYECLTNSCRRSKELHPMIEIALAAKSKESVSQQP
uniref:GRANULINS domain-containing protein n=1 Tax=Ascaris lumbricoides TaxID=6252 RepID=A0A0M3IFC1_ASCLU